MAAATGHGAFMNMRPMFAAVASSLILAVASAEAAPFCLPKPGATLPLRKSLRAPVNAGLVVIFQAHSNEAEFRACDDIGCVFRLHRLEYKDGRWRARSMAERGVGKRVELEYAMVAEHFFMPKCRADGEEGRVVRKGRARKKPRQTTTGPESNAGGMADLPTQILRKPAGSREQTHHQLRALSPARRRGGVLAALMRNQDTSNSLVDMLNRGPNSMSNDLGGLTGVKAANAGSNVAGNPAGNGVKRHKAKLINRVNPVYPKGENRIGYVRVLMRVDSGGKVSNVRVTRKTSQAFADAAIAAAKVWKFEPAFEIRKGKKVTVKSIYATTVQIRPVD